MSNTNNMKNKIILFLLTFITSTAFASKSDLSILYVGWNPDHPVQVMKVGHYGENVFEKQKLRWGDFIHFLGEHFKKVTAVHHMDYKAIMSDEYDVTIFDALPKKLNDEILETDSSGKIIRYESAEYLKKGYSAATLAIAAISVDLEASLKTKFDWCCLCLDKYALNTDTKHDIFNLPNKVNLKWENRPTSEEFLRYGKGYADSMQMWRVQEIGLDKVTELPPGLISHGDGFTDSPDAEFISDGLHTKAPGQVALGRHGNFFHWGFSAPPKHMTEQGRLVFLNAIHYIAKFKGQKPLSKKLFPYIWLSHYAKDKLNKDYQKAYHKQETYIANRNKKWLDIKRVAQEKHAQGKILSDEEKYFLKFTIPKKLSIQDFMKIQEPILYPKFGLDFKEYNTFYQTYSEYMRADPDNMMSFIVDYDAIKLGMSFKNPDFLRTCVKALGNRKTKELALRLLIRYTDQDLETPSQWKKWVKENERKLFFCETAGYKWLVNKLL